MRSARPARPAACPSRSDGQRPRARQAAAWRHRDGRRRRARVTRCFRTASASIGASLAGIERFSPRSERGEGASGFAGSEAGGAGRTAELPSLSSLALRWRLGLLRRPAPHWRARDPRRAAGGALGVFSFGMPAIRLQAPGLQGRVVPALAPSCGASWREAVAGTVGPRRVLQLWSALEQVDTENGDHAPWRGLDGQLDRERQEEPGGRARRYHGTGWTRSHHLVHEAHRRARPLDARKERHGRAEPVELAPALRAALQVRLRSRRARGRPSASSSKADSSSRASQWQFMAEIAPACP